MQRVDPQDLKRIVILASVIAALLVSSTSIFGLLASQPTSGIVADVTLGVYTNPDCTTNMTAVYWGACYLGETKTVVAYVKNLGNVTITLTIQASNWTPSTSSQYISWTHDYLGREVPSETVIPVAFNLYLSPDTVNIDTFSFDIILTSQG